jgi:phage-related protein
MKPIIWMGGSKDSLVAFPDDARREAGHQLERVQRCLDPSDWKPMVSVGSGVREIRIRDDSGTFRVMYLATRPEGVYVLHCFQKKTRRTAKRDLQLACSRFRTLSRG